MAVSRNVAEDFIEKYKDIAIEHQIKYGIPASVTLAQACLESAYGTSGGAKNQNMFFGIKANSTWKGEVAQYWDDEAGKSNFRAYPTPEASFADHARLLTTKHYQNYCGRFAPTDHYNWLIGIKAGRYATDDDYVAKNEGVIRDYGLEKYDKMAMEEAARRKVTCGYLKGDRSSFFNPSNTVSNEQVLGNKQYFTQSDNLALPIDFSNPNVKVSSNFGDTKGRDHVHHGLDISTGGQNLPIHVTQGNGKVVANDFEKGGAGNYVKIQYDMPNGKSFQCVYMHLKEKSPLEKDQIVNHNDLVGYTGNTGHSSGTHLHFEVRELQKDGSWKAVSPVNYLAEISVRTGQQDVALKAQDGKTDYLAQAKSNMAVVPAGDLAQQTNSNDPNKWMNLLAQQSGSTLDDSQDPISSLIKSYFTSLLVVMVRMTDRAKGDKMDAENKSLAEKNSPEAKQQRDDLRDRNTITQKVFNEGKQTASVNFELQQNKDSQNPSQQRSMV